MQSDNGMFPIVIWKQIFQYFVDFRDYQVFACLNKKFRKVIKEMMSEFREMVLVKYPMESQLLIREAEQKSTERWNWMKIGRNHLRSSGQDRCNRCYDKFAKQDQTFLHVRGPVFLPLIEYCICAKCNSISEKDLKQYVVLPSIDLEQGNDYENGFDCYFHQKDSKTLYRIYIHKTTTMEDLLKNKAWTKKERIGIFDKGKDLHFSL